MISLLFYQLAPDVDFRAGHFLAYKNAEFIDNKHTNSCLY